MNDLRAQSQFPIVEEIWKEILRRTEIDRDRTFMDLGGTSLSGAQLVARVSKRLGISIPVTKLFEHPTLRQFVNFIDGGENLVSPTSPEPIAPKSNSDRDIAIVGMACRFPGARNLSEFWNNLLAGKDSIEDLTKEELSPEISEELKNDPRYVRARGRIADPFKLDAAFFDINPMEAKLIDPQQRVMLETAWEALEHAGHGPGSFSGRAAVFAGIEDNSYYKSEILPFPEAEKRAGRLSIMTGNEKDFVAMRIAHKLNLKGPAVSVHTACSTSLVAVVMACQSLRQGESDLAVAGGASIHFPVNEGYYFQEGGIFSSDGRCRPFDRDAQGTIFTDGAGAVVLKRVKDALRDRDTIYAVIKGGAINNDGGEKISFSAPSISGQASCISDALHDAQIDPRTIQYVEAHGTATPVGDPIEVEALRQSFRRKTQDRQFCGLGSVKSNLGHTTAAAGVAGLIKTALALQNKVIPPTIHFKSPNPDLQLENSPFYIVDRLIEWKREGAPRRAGLSSFGIGGTNSHVILEEAPLPLAPQEINMPRPFEILPVSAKSKASRDRLLESLSTFAGDARDAAFTLQQGRSRFKIRGARVKFPDGADLVVGRDETIADPKLTFIFPGQGSQYIEMGRSLDAQFPEFRETFSRCCEILSRELALDFRSFIFDPSNQETLENTRYTQPALFAIEVSLGRMLLGWGLKPDLLIGHSVGEFAAAHLAGIFTLEEGLRLIVARGRLMGSLPRGKMLSARGALGDILALAGDSVDVASINSPLNQVLAGETDAIAAVQARLEEHQIPCKLLHTSHAFHSRMMAPVVEPYLEIAREVQFQSPRFPMISTVTGKRLSDAEATDPRYWAEHMRMTVQFSPAVATAIALGANVFLEVGPRSTLATLVAQHLKHSQGTAISTLGDKPDPQAEIGTLGSALAKLWATGLELPWERIWSGGTRVALPAYPFEKSDYRFSEGRTRTIPNVSEPAREESPLPAAAEASTSELLLSELGKLFSEYSGMDMPSPQTTFVESGFDSLVLMQIGVELAKKYGVAVSLRELMEKTNTLERLSAALLNQAPPEKLPRKLPAAAAAPAVRPGLTTTLPTTIATPAAPASQPSGDIVQTIHQQLTQMKELLELQLKFLAQTGQAPGAAQAPAAPRGAPGLIRAKHEQPPVPDAFLAQTPDGREAWFRFDPRTERYEMLESIGNSDAAF